MPEMNVSVREGAHTRRTSPRQKKPVKRKSKRRMFLMIGIFFLLLIAGGAGAVYWQLNSAIGKISETSPTQPGGIVVDPEYHADKPISFVILGRDSRPETGTMLTDVMIVAVANPKTKHVTMMSIPRDTRVKIPGYSGYHKINSVFANGDVERRQAEAQGLVPQEDGPSLVKKTLQDMLGIPVEHYVNVDFEGFKALIDELGGVEVNVDRKLVYDDPTDNTHINLEPGLQVLNGTQALGYVRHRHDNRGTKYYSSDFDRNRRQQEVIRAMVTKATSLGGVTKIFDLINVGASHVKTDLSPEQIKGLATDFITVDPSTFVTLESGAYWSASDSYTYLEKDKLEENRQTLQREMELTEEMIAQLTKESSSSKLGLESASGSEPVKKKKKQTTEAATEPPKSTKPATSTKETQPADSTETTQPGTDATGTNPDPNNPENNGGLGPEHNGEQTVDPGTMPPPDIPTTDQTGGETPPDVVPEQTTPPVTSGETPLENGEVPPLSTDTGTTTTQP